MEGRVSMQPDGVAELVHHGHEVVVQAGAGRGAGFTDEEYEEAGARLVDGPEEVFEAADLIVKVKEPVPEEYDRFREGQQLFTYLHLAADKGLTEFLMERKINSIAYETVETSDGLLPLLTPMSEVAGRMSVQAAAHHLESPQGGAGLLLGGVPGTPAAKVTIIGGGVVGTEAAKIALGMRALVSVLDISPKRLAYLSDIFEGRADLVIPNRARTAAYVRQADVVIGAVLVHGAKAPKLVSREMVRSMRPGSVVADVAIDQGGCIETARPTTHSDPTYVEEGVVHYCVANIPGAVARTSTLALTSATLPYLIHIADKGIEGAATEDEALAKGLSTLRGDLVSEPVAEAHDLSYTDASKILG
jgi:alanine dehydrogenase